MKLLNIILPIIAVASVSGQSEGYDDVIDPSDDYDEIDPGFSRRGLRGSQGDRRLWWETNAGNGGNARTGNAYGPYGTTGNAYGGHGGNGNVAVQRGWGGPWWWGPPRRGSMNVGNGGHARTGSAYGPFGTTGDAYGGYGGNGNVAVNDWWW